MTAQGILIFWTDCVFALVTCQQDCSLSFLQLRYPASSGRPASSQGGAGQGLPFLPP